MGQIIESSGNDLVSSSIPVDYQFFPDDEPSIFLSATLPGEPLSE